MRRHVIAWTLAGSVAGCSYIFKLPASRTDLGPDASAGTSADGGEVDEASAPSSFCATQATPPLYCEDFDGTTEPELASVGSLKTKDGEVVVETDVVLSAPRALRTSVNGAGSSAAITRTLDGTPNGITLSFDLFVETWQTPRAQLAQIKLEDAGGTCVFELLADATSYSVVQDCPTVSVPTATSRDVALGKWQRFSMAVRFDPTPTVSLNIDGAVVIDAAALASMKPSRTSVLLGIDLATSGNAVLYQDNVLVTSP